MLRPLQEILGMWERMKGHEKGKKCSHGKRDVEGATGWVEGWKGRVVEKVVDLFSYSHMYELYVRSFHIHAHYCAAGHVGVCV
jgi:hypothetical protein